jgi:glycopeptide antibiotics resistance protein
VLRKRKPLGVSCKPKGVNKVVLDFDIAAWFIGIVLLVVVLRKRRNNFPYLLFFSAFWIYILLLLKVEVFPIPLARGISEETVQAVLPRMLSALNLQLFFFGPFATLESIAVTVLQNLIMTIPFGFGISFIKPLRVKDVLWLSIAVGFGIEVIQFVIGLYGVFLGMWSPDHIVDINDALLNMVGIWIGYGLFRIFASWYAANQHRFKDNPFFAYIQNVTSQV